jgi:uncharacterized protein (TIGR00730 family)
VTLSEDERIAVQDKGQKDRGQDDLLSFDDLDFLRREEMRANRLSLEFAKADLGLRDQDIKSTVVVFGSSRAVTPRAAKRRIETAQGDKAISIAKRVSALSVWYEQARTFGRIVSERGGALSFEHGVRENVITTGGGPGIMEAANRGAADVGAPNIGFNISLPTEQRPNKFLTPELSFRFHYFAVRKMHFAMRANALVVFPGGFGTMDELFEILTLKQTRKTPAMPVILFGRDYWKNIINFEALAECCTIDEQDLALFEIVDSAEEGWQALIEHGLTAQTPLREA